MARDKSKAESQFVNVFIGISSAFIDALLVMWAADICGAAWGYWKSFVIAIAVAAVIGSGTYTGTRSALRRVRDEVD